MKIKISGASLTVVLASVLTVPYFAFAAPGAGIKPDSAFYFFDIVFERIGLFFTFNPEGKIQKALAHAEERLAEAEAVALANKPEAISRAMEEYQSRISLATERAREVDNEDQSEKLLTTIAESTAKHQEVLAEVHNKVPEEAKKAIEKAIEVSIGGREEVLKHVQELKEIPPKTQEEIDALREEIESLKRAQSQPRSVSTSAARKLSNKEIISKVKPAVVYIETTGGSGSGMIIESDGTILTNAHVVKDVYSAKVKLSDGKLFIGTVLGRNEVVDLTLLKIDVHGLPTVEFGNSDAVEQGDEVFTLGYPFGLGGDVSFKEGTISRRITESGASYLETSAEIHPGNSGGPLVNKGGQVVGINTAVFGETVRGVTLGETIKLAIPINLAVKLLPTLMSSGQEEFVARLGKASGIVIFFNGFSSAPQKLVASTRIQSPEGLIFRIKKDIIIPGSEIIRDKIVPGQVEAEVVADEQGSKYNIGLAEFQVPGFRGTPRFDSIYARSLAPFTGGGE